MTETNLDIFWIDDDSSGDRRRKKKSLITRDNLLI